MDTGPTERGFYEDKFTELVQERNSNYANPPAKMLLLPICLLTYLLTYLLTSTFITLFLSLTSLSSV